MFGQGSCRLPSKLGRGYIDLVRLTSLWQFIQAALKDKADIFCSSKICKNKCGVCKLLYHFPLLAILAQQLRQ